MENELDKVDEQTVRISSKQKGDIVENRVSEMITLSSKGELTCYTPNTDDDGIDLIVNPRAAFRPLFIQVKSRFVLQKSGLFIQNVGKNTFTENELFYLLFVYFNQTSLEVEKLWLVPSIQFRELANEVAGGKTFKAFYRFTAGPKSMNDKWAKFSIDKAKLGDKLVHIIEECYAGIGDIGAV